MGGPGGDFAGDRSFDLGAREHQFDIGKLCLDKGEIGAGGFKRLHRANGGGARLVGGGLRGRTLGEKRLGAGGDALGLIGLCLALRNGRAGGGE